MRYSKPATDISTQLARLQAKGLVIPDLAEATRYLTYIGYFRLKGYCLPFQDAGRQFIPGTTFDQVARLYQFDRALRALVMDEIERLEVAIRTVICNELSLSHGPHWYLTHYENIFHMQKFDVFKFLQDVSRDTRRSKDLFAVHYYNQYSEPSLPPSWVMSECASFGLWSRLYAGLKIGKSNIANRFRLPAPTFESWVHVLTVLRNVSAHHGQVWNRKFLVTPVIQRSIGTHHFTNLKSFYPLAVIIRYMARQIDPQTDFPDRLRTLLKANPVIAPSDMGFPASWDLDAFWL